MSITNTFTFGRQHVLLEIRSEAGACASRADEEVLDEDLVTRHNGGKEQREVHAWSHLGYSELDSLCCVQLVPRFSVVPGGPGNVPAVRRVMVAIY